MIRMGKLLAAGTGLGTCCLAAAMLTLPAGPAAAGPCSEQLSEVSRQLANSPAMGTPTSGALAGTAPGAIQNDPQTPQQGAPSGAADPAGEQGVKGQAVVTTMAGNAPGSMSQPLDPAAGKATSAQDVRLQQMGQPTAAQGGNLGGTEERMSQAKSALESARMLDQQGDQGCMAKLDEARKLMAGGG